MKNIFFCLYSVVIHTQCKLHNIMEIKATLFLSQPAPPMTVEQLYQSQQHTCSGNDAELIAFNPDAADNTRVCSLTQRAQSMRREREREN